MAKKVRKSEAIPRTIENNGVIALVEYVLLPAAKLSGKNEFRVECRDAEPLTYTNIQQLKDDYVNDIVWHSSLPLGFHRLMANIV